MKLRVALLILAMLFVAGISGVLIILYNVIKAYMMRRKIQKTLMQAKSAT